MSMSFKNHKNSWQYYKNISKNNMCTKDTSNILFIITLNVYSIILLLVIKKCNYICKQKQ